MARPLARPVALTAAATLVALALSTVSPAFGAPRNGGGGGGCNPHKSSCTTQAAPPSVQISAPTGGVTVDGSITASGTASSPVGLASVALAVDGGAWQAATGTTSWSAAVSTWGLADGTHTLTVRATDVTGVSGQLTESVTVDNTPPTIAIASPGAGTMVSGVVTISGSAADAVLVAAVDVSVDGGAWTRASGTASWSDPLDTSGLPNGTHTITARATDGAGHTTLVNVPVSVQNGTAGADTTPPAVSIAAPSVGATVSGTVTVTGSASDNTAVAAVSLTVDGGAPTTVSGTTSWSYTWDSTSVADGSHTLTATATDTSGNTTSSAVTVAVSNGSFAPVTWVSPEGVTIKITTPTGGWSVNQIYSMLKASALDLTTIGPHYTVVVEDSIPSQSTIGASTTNGVYTSVDATTYLDAASGYTFSIEPDAVIAHEYGHVWVNWHRYLDWQGSWSAYLNERWSSSNGSVTLATDPRLDSSYIWSQDEIAADDYRLLFGSPPAISESDASLNQQIVDPRQQPGLSTWFLQNWATGTCC